MRKGLEEAGGEPAVGRSQGSQETPAPLGQPAGPRELILQK